MNRDTGVKEYMEKMGTLKLSESSRIRIENSLLEYARFHSVKTGAQTPVRVGGTDRSMVQVQRNSVYTLFINSKLNTMKATLLIALLIGAGGTSFAAQSSLPGDFLYPVKVQVNENIRSAFVVGADAEAKLQADLLAERVSEVEMLKAQGDISDELSLAIATRVKTQITDAEEVFALSSESVAIAARAEARASIGQYNSLFANGSTLLIDIDSVFIADKSFSNEVQTEPVDVEFLISGTQARITTTAKIITSAEANIRASVKTELMAKLTAATNLLVTAKTQSEVDARETAFKASLLVGEVEVALSLLGLVEIDSDTGAIIYIDFNGSTNGSATIDCNQIPSTMGPESLAWQAACAVDIDFSGNENGEVKIDCNKIPSTMGPEALAWQAACTGETNQSNDAKP